MLLRRGRRRRPPRRLSMQTPGRPEIHRRPGRHPGKAKSRTHDLRQMLAVIHGERGPGRRPEGVGSLAASSRSSTTPRCGPKKRSTPAKTTQPCRRSCGTTLPANGRNPRTTGESCGSAQLQQKSARNGPTRVAAPTTGTSKPEPGRMAACAHSPAANPNPPRAPGSVRHRPRRAHILWYPRRGTGVHHYRRAWDKARRTALTPPNTPHRWPGGSTTCAMPASPRGSTAASRPPKVAEWAGHSVAVLLRVYAKCIDGQDQIAKRPIEEALRDTDS